MIYHLSAPSKADLWNALAAAGLMRDGEPMTISQSHALDVIGVIHAPTGQILISDDGDEYAETAPIDGYFANLMMIGAEIHPALQTFVIPPPATPRRVFG